MFTWLVVAAIGLVIPGALAAVMRSEGWIRHAVEIDAPVEEVWAYGSDSRRASDWSVYFHHITPETDPAKPADGTVGAFRVCYRNADEQGIRWDETTEEIVEHEHRRIRTFNLVGFPFGAFGRMQEFEVHQHYERIDANRCRLIFSSKVVPRRDHDDRLLWPIIKAVYVVFGAPAGQVVFVWNVENIKAAVEAQHRGEEYVRPHPYAIELPWEATPLRWWLRDRLRALTRAPIPAAREVVRVPATA